jgi:hypothetical protein
MPAERVAASFCSGLVEEDPGEVPTEQSQYAPRPRWRPGSVSPGRQTALPELRFPRTRNTLSPAAPAVDDSLRRPHRSQECLYLLFQYFTVLLNWFADARTLAASLPALRLLESMLATLEETSRVPDVAS